MGAICLVHGSPSCPWCMRMHCGISRCCRAGHEGHRGAPSDPVCPPVQARVAPGRKVLPPQERRAGAAAMSAWLGRARPVSKALPAVGPPGQPAVHCPATEARGVGPTAPGCR